MPSVNLATVVGPNLLRPPPPDFGGASSASGAGGKGGKRGGGMFKRMLRRFTPDGGASGGPASNPPSAASLALTELMACPSICAVVELLVDLRDHVLIIPASLRHQMLHHMNSCASTPPPSPLPSPLFTAFLGFGFVVCLLLKPRCIYFVSANAIFNHNLSLGHEAPLGPPKPLPRWTLVLFWHAFKVCSCNETVFVAETKLNLSVQ
jgi:hypothetical protein